MFRRDLVAFIRRTLNQIIKLEIKELDKEIKTRKTEARKMLNLEKK